MIRLAVSAQKSGAHNVIVKGPPSSMRSECFVGGGGVQIREGGSKSASGYGPGGPNPLADPGGPNPL